jgi:hypothetical protein
MSYYHCPQCNAAIVGYGGTCDTQGCEVRLVLAPTPLYLDLDEEPGLDQSNDFEYVRSQLKVDNDCPMPYWIIRGIRYTLQEANRYWKLRAFS